MSTPPSSRSSTASSLPPSPPDIRCAASPGHALPPDGAAASTELLRLQHEHAVQLMQLHHRKEARELRAASRKREKALVEHDLEQRALVRGRRGAPRGPRAGALQHGSLVGVPGTWLHDVHSCTVALYSTSLMYDCL